VTRHALLLKANANRVFGESAYALTQAELGALDGHVLGGIVRAQERTTIAEVGYLVVDTDGPLDAECLAVLSNLSSLHALFEVAADGRFQPIPCAPRQLLDDDLITIQRYAGKTNEAFTHLLVNVALAASGDAFRRMLAGEPVRLLDPACGRGTSLNRAALYGMDAFGIELDERDVEAFDVFFTTFLKNKRMKHKAERSTLRKGRTTPAHRTTITYGIEKDPRTHRVVDIVHDDTLAAREHAKSRSMDLLVCDLPYGVQHGSRSSTHTLDRGPERLLEGALPGWLDLLKPGGAAGLAWNRRTLPRTRLVELARGAGFDVPAPDDDSFLHRVDRAITRDVLVAIRPAR
jgi:SAM-dependent methyltransferase